VHRVAWLGRIERRRGLELTQRRIQSAGIAVRAAERVVEPGVTRGQAHGLLEVLLRRLARAQPRVGEPEIIVSAGVARRGRHRVDEVPHRAAVIPLVELPDAALHRPPALAVDDGETRHRQSDGGERDRPSGAQQSAVGVQAAPQGRGDPPARG
jgi:hypothetical protein